ncbi:MAG TPA: hypothetical protein VMU59_15335 [Caulobacteraceae bacterium]|nr:hypothetical protein [Caulobacteraceae bacterium]
MRGVVLAGTAVTRPDCVGSLYRLEEGGAWEKVASIPADASVQAITPHPTEKDVVFAATRKGVFRSGDAGRTWAQLSAPTEGRQYWCVAINPDNPNLMFAGGGPPGFFRSEDGGETWQATRCDHPERFKITFGHSRAMKVAFHPTNPDILYSAVEINGLLVSTDGGDSWRAANNGVDHLSHVPELQNREVTDDDTEGMYDAHSVCTTKARPDTVFYGCRMGIFSTDDLGESLTDLEVRRFAPFRYTRDVRVSADDPRTLYACFSIASRSHAGAMYRSTDLGETWSRVDEAMTAKSTIMGFGVHAMDGRGVASVTRHGQVFHTTDGCATWAETQLPPDAGDAFCAAIL